MSIINDIHCRYTCYTCIFIISNIKSANYVQEKLTKSQRICICTSFTENIASYAKLSVEINNKYAKRHGYDFVVKNEVMTDRAPQWCKIKVINDLLALNKYDYIFWIDADAFFNDQSIKLETLINDNFDNKYNMLICNDDLNSGAKNRVNSGTFLINTSQWCKDLFKLIWEYKGKYLYDYFHEQTIIEQVIESNMLGAKDKIKVMGGNVFNSELHHVKNGNAEFDYVTHLMGSSQEYRINFMTKWIHKHGL